MKVAVFKLAFGEINRVVEASASTAQNQAQPGEGWVACADDTNDLIHWINPVTLLREDRPAMPGTLNKATITSDGQDEATISNLPQPCIATINWEPYEITDGTLVLTSDIPMVFKVEVEAFPHLPATFEVEAIECE
jgi:hypothetical protein